MSGSPDCTWNDVNALNRPSINDDTGKLLVYLSDSQSLPMLKKFIQDELHISPRYKRELLNVVETYLSPDQARMFIPKPNRFMRYDPLIVKQNKILLEIRCTRFFRSVDDSKRINCRVFENRIYDAVCSYISRAQGLGAERQIAPQIPTKTITESTQFNPDYYNNQPQQQKQKSWLEKLI